MSDGLRRRYPALLLLAAGSLLAAISFWALEFTRRSGPDTPEQSQRTEPDYFIEDFSYTRLTANGKAQYLITGKKLVHHPVDDSSTVESPSVRSFSSSHGPMVLSAKRARITHNNKELHMYDNVRLERPQTRGGASLIVESDYMLALPDQDIVKSDHPVLIRLGETKLAGTGMVADNTRQQLTLLNKVSGYYESPR